MSSSTNFMTKAVIMAVLATGMVLGPAGPAAAATAGAGSGTGWEYPPDSEPCATQLHGAEFDSDRFELSHYGTYDSSGAGTTTVASYLGDTDATITVGTHAAGPLGTYGGGCPSDPTALTPTPITAVEITGTALVAGTTGSVDCTLDASAAPAEYQRIGNVVTFTFAADCDITGNVDPLTGSVHAEDVVHVIEGTMDPCTDPVTETDNPECGTIEDPEPGGAGSHLVTSYEAAEGEPVT